MIEKALGVISGIKIITKNGIASDGSNVKIPLQEFKVETSDINYEIIEKHFPDIYEYVKPNQTRIVLKTAKFDVTIYNLVFEFFRIPNTEEKEDDMVKYTYENITLQELTVTYKENVPTYGFLLHKQIEKSDYYLSNASKIHLKFSLEYK